MGTTYSVTITNFIHDKSTFKHQLDSLLLSFNNKFSTYIDDSEISIINNNIFGESKLSDDFSYVLKKALYYCNISDGNYDITINPLIELWGFGKNDNQELPDSISIVNALKKTGYKKIILEDDILINNNNIQFDFNSIAKGYGVDIISEYVLDRGYKQFIVEIGGEIRCSSNSIKEWIIGIQNPISNSIIKKVKLKNKSLATSGTYNNYFENNGIHYSHIINPKTGYPYLHKTISATIIADKCIDADAYATLAMTMNPNDVLDIINKENQIECYIMELTRDNEIIEYKSKYFEDFIF